ncbi:ubiquinone/menaquinone [Ramicandelaber brevisporus]|nr:ubiquinone/menaquinone [Ramicandelaber brevisporus]
MLRSANNNINANEAEQLNQQQQQQPSSSSTTHFGFRDVREEDKEHLVKQVFSSVAENYDIMNDFMSGGIHRIWKDMFIREMAPTPGTTLLDVAGGTGDIALRFLDYTAQFKSGSPQSLASVRVVDINPQMLEVGRRRFQGSEYEQRGQIDFAEGNAENLADIPDSSVDVYTIAFGIRNCTHVDRVLQEAFRVLKPGGRFMCLEFSHVSNPLIGKVYDLYSFEVIPAIGQAVAQDRESYQYLVESIRRFPNQLRFAQMIRDAGFEVGSLHEGSAWTNLTFGVAAIHSGIKPF